MKKLISVALLVMGAMLLASVAPALAAEPDRITDDTTVREVESQIMASEDVELTQTTVTLGEVEYIRTIRLTASEVAYVLVMEFVYQPYETADGKWGYPCVGVNRYLVRK